MRLPDWLAAFSPVLAPLPGGRSVGETLIDTVMARLGLSPMLDDRVVVEVAGQPGVTKQQLYFLALAAANGIVRRFGDLVGVVPGFGRLGIEYDAADHWVRATLTYRWSMAATVADGPSGGPRIGDVMDRMAVYRGPQCDVNGGKFDFSTGTRRVPGIPNPAAVTPELPFEGQPILTACPRTKTPTPQPIRVNPPASVPVSVEGAVIDSPNPKPPGDNRSRGAVMGSPTDPGSAGGTPVPGPTPTADRARCCYNLRLLIPLVYSALSGAATNNEMTYDAPTAGPTGG